MSRDDLLRINLKGHAASGRQSKGALPDASMIAITNRLDAMVLGRCRSFSGLPAQKGSFGHWPACSTRQRFRHFLADEFQCSPPRSIRHRLRARRHTATEQCAPLVRYSTLVGGIPLPTTLRRHGLDLRQDVSSTSPCRRRTRKGGGEIVGPNKLKTRAPPLTGAGGLAPSGHGPEELPSRQFAGSCPAPAHLSPASYGGPPSPGHCSCGRADRDGAQRSREDRREVLLHGRRRRRCFENSVRRREDAGRGLQGHPTRRSPEPGLSPARRQLGAAAVFF